LQLSLFLNAMLCLGAADANKVRELDRALMKAAQNKDARAVEALLKEGADPNAHVPGTYGYTPLTQAICAECCYGGVPDLKVTKLLLDHGADLYLEAKNQLPPFFYASNKRCEQIARFLISRGVDVNRKNSEGETALLHDASIDIAELKFLLDLGADPNATDEDGVTVLMRIAATSHVLSKQEVTQMENATRYLVRRGARVNALDHRGNTALFYSAEHRGNIPATRGLVAAGIDINKKNAAGSRALSSALDEDEEQTCFLIDHGADVKFVTEEGYTTLIQAAVSDQAKSVAKLLQRGVSPLAKTKDGLTASHAAAQQGGSFSDTRSRQGPMEILRLLAHAGADLRAIDNDGQTPLHLAAKKGYAGIVRFLLEQKVDPNTANKKSETPLLLAATSDLDSFDKVQLLVSKGARIEGSDSAMTTTPLMAAARLMKKSVVTFLLEKGANVERKDGNGNSVLNLAASSFQDRILLPEDYTTIIRAIAAHLKSVDESDSQGITPLMWASASNVPEAVEELLQRHADINAHSRDGRTPLMYAAAANALKAIPLLVSRGADANARDQSGRTALDWAKWMNQSEVVKLSILQPRE
jgi:ankyrin repeat protein